jgi:hypothetical protein
MGNYVSAEPLFRRALAIIKKVSGEENSNYSTTLDELALLYKITGKYASAEPLYKRSAIRRVNICKLF